MSSNFKKKLNDERTSGNVGIPSVNHDEMFVIRDINGVQMGWSDWNENEPSYFDEAYATDDSFTSNSAGFFGVDSMISPLTSFGNRVTMHAKDASKLNPEESVSNPIELLDGSNGGGGEWADWDNEAFLGLDTDFE